jgi:hypothetical protein
MLGSVKAAFKRMSLVDPDFDGVSVGGILCGETYAFISPSERNHPLRTALPPEQAGQQSKAFCHNPGSSLRAGEDYEEK